MNITVPISCKSDLLHVILLKYHPDVNKQPGATEKFKEISAAYEVCNFFLVSYFLFIFIILSFEF